VVPNGIYRAVLAYHETAVRISEQRERRFRRNVNTILGDGEHDFGAT